MAIVKFQQEQNRGAAGESMSSPKTGYNFANMYALNRNDQAGNKLKSVTQQAQGINNLANQSQNLFKSKGGADTFAGQDMASAVQKAKGLSNQVQGYNPAAQAVKAGQSAYQAGVSSFYGGGANNPAIQKIRGFSNIYQNMLGRQQSMNQQIADSKATGNTTIPVPTDGKPPLTQAMQDAQAADKSNNDKNKAYVRSDEQSVTHNLSNLDWMLKTGRITNQEYYRAQRDNDFYKMISDKYN